MDTENTVKFQTWTKPYWLVENALLNYISRYFNTIQIELADVTVLFGSLETP